MHSNTAASPKGHTPAPRFGEFELDLQARELTRDGRRIRLQEQPFQVLVMLLGRAGQVVTREELRQKLWPSSVYVDFDHGLNNAIGRLRETLGDVAATPRFIETLPRLGYRFIASVTHSRAPEGVHADDDSLARPAEAGAAVPSLSARKPLWHRRGDIAAATIVALAIIAMLLIGPLRLTGPADETLHTSAGVKPQSIAVLPFLDMSAAQDQGYLADGITEEILNRLTRAGNLRVISRTSSFAFRGKPVDIREVAEQLEVSHVLEGSIRKSGNTVRITAQLIAADDNAHVWSNTFDRELGDLLAVQDEIAVSVASALQIQLATTPAVGRPPASAEAYEKYLEGRFFNNRRAPGDWRRAMTHFQQAVELDPHYAVAWAALAGAYTVAADEGEISWEEAREEQLAAAEQAVRIAPQLADGHYRMAQYYWNEGDIAAGRSSLLKAHALDPFSSPDDDPLAYLHDDFDKAIRYGQEELARDPLSAVTHMNHAVILFAVGRLDEAKSHILKTLELSPDFGSNAEIEMVRILVAQRHYAEARARTLQLPDDGKRDHGLALLFDSPEYRAEADAALDRLEKSPKDDMMHCIRLAEVYALRGMPEPAFGALERFTSTLDAADKRTALKRWEMQVELGISPFLKGLHDDPRWTALMARAD